MPWKYVCKYVALISICISDRIANSMKKYCRLSNYKKIEIIENKPNRI